MTFHCIDAATFVAPLHIWLTTIVNAMPSDVTLQIEPNGDVFEATTGQITGEWIGSAQAPLAGTQLGAYAAPVGGLVTWTTPFFTGGRRLKGRTFVVPMTSASFDLTGSIAAASLVGMKNDADAFIAATASNFAVWQRPRLARAAVGTLPALPARPGIFGLVTGSRVPDKCVVLRSRRD